MPKRYRRTTIDVFQRRDVALHDFPSGEGPPVYVTAFGPEWIRLAPGQGALLELTGDDGGAFAWGMANTIVAIWTYTPAAQPGRAYCQHLPPGPASPVLHQTACNELGFELGCEPRDLRVLLAGRREITEDDERVFLRLGVLPSRLHTYSNALLTQFGLSKKGSAGEAG